MVAFKVIAKGKNMFNDGIKVTNVASINVILMLLGLSGYVFG